MIASMSDGWDLRSQSDAAGVSPVPADGGTGGTPVSVSTVVITGEDWLDAICPFLRGGDGSWRSASPVREHRCWATDPPSELPVLTQQRLCLVRAHDGCERFLHARELRSRSLARERGPSVDTPPVGMAAARVVPPHANRVGIGIREGLAAILRLPRLLLVGVLVVGVAALVVIALLLPGSGSGSGSPTPAPSVPSVEATRDPADAEPSLGLDGDRRYRVREGDTLRTIADRFDVSVRQLRLANDLGEPPRLDPGEVIVIPGGD